MTTFAPEIVSAVCAHMNDDHADDSLRIVHAFAHADATSAVMSGADADAGVWDVSTGNATESVRIAWPAAPINERAEIRREVVALHELACEKLGITPPTH